MTVVDTTTDLDSLTLIVVTQLAAPPERVWQVWTDPRQLERWWGPPSWPARFTRHDVVVGGESRYAMTGPDGTAAGGWWRFTALDEPRSLEFDDGFTGPDGEPAEDMPVTRARVDLEPVAGGTRMTVRSRFASREQMQQVLDMGVVEGLTAALAQVDDVLAVPA
ncbi:SRPBCC family protein [Trujillonella humicola]|uniref:SRPBCC family protein n=1 Tax=Trujillonella humicola TaxID=3383699 RepID=UPI003905A3AB